MRFLALICTLIFSLDFAIPAHAGEVCECPPFQEMSRVHCCQVPELPLDCCLQTESEPACSLDWIWERSLTSATPQLVLLAVLDTLNASEAFSVSAAFPTEYPPPLCGRRLRASRQIWLI